MDIKAALYSYLTGKASFTSQCSTRLYPQAAPQGSSHPYITYKENDSKRPVHLAGASAFCDTVFSFKIHAATSDNCDAVKEVMRNILHGRFTFQAPDGTNTIDIRSATLLNKPEPYENTPDSTDIGIWECDMDFRIIFLETLPTLP